MTYETYERAKQLLNDIEILKKTVIDRKASGELVKEFNEFFKTAVNKRKEEFEKL